MQVVDERQPVQVGGDAGFTLTEMLVVMAILGVILAGLTQLLVSALHSQTDQTVRAQGQQDARLALAKLRREIHCGGTVSPNPNGIWPTKAITITLGSWCPTNSAGSVSVTWCTSATAPYTLWRYPHSTDLSAGSYAAACTGSGRSWANDVVNAGGVTGGQIFSNPITPTLPAMEATAITYGAVAGPWGSNVSDQSFGYIVDPVVTISGVDVEQPGIEAGITIRVGTTGKTIKLDWGTACTDYPSNASIKKFKVYGRSEGGELLMKTITSAACAVTTYIDDNTDTPTTTPPTGATRSKLTVTVPVRADSSAYRLITLRDDITLLNTPR
jgi:prepilin-type N-terminal cleavage/methylation domain-containing protein